MAPPFAWIVLLAVAAAPAVLLEVAELLSVLAQLPVASVSTKVRNVNLSMATTIAGAVPVGGVRSAE